MVERPVPERHAVRSGIARPAGIGVSRPGMTLRIGPDRDHTELTGISGVDERHSVRGDRLRRAAEPCYPGRDRSDHRRLDA